MKMSKSKFVVGVQCLKRLYLQVHEPELAAEPDEGSKAVIEQGRQVGLVAQKAFPGGATVEAGPDQLSKALELTQHLLAKSDLPAIFEGTFQHDNVLIRADVLKKRGLHGHRLIEVKSSTEMKPHYAYDLAIQRHVLEGAEIQIDKAQLMHLNREYVFDGNEYDLSKLFVVVAPKREEEISGTEISDRLKEQFRILKKAKPPDIKSGKQCVDPYRCEFYDHCNPKLPTDHIRLLPRISEKKVLELEAGGIVSIRKIPVTFALTETQRRAVESVKNNQGYFSPQLADELDALKYPLCFMDFETVFPALPRFANMAPYDHIPFQWSIHRQEKPSQPIKHLEYLAEDGSDPRMEFARSLLEAVDAAGTIIVYNKAFEHSRLDDLARWLPKHASDIEKVKAKLWDLLVAIRKNVYHPKFAGSFSLKSVLPALLPDMQYENLEIADGTAAGLAWIRFVDSATGADERKRLKKALLKYCGQDTLGLVRLIDVLRKNA